MNSKLYCVIFQFVYFLINELFAHAYVGVQCGDMTMITDDNETGWFEWVWRLDIIRIMTSIFFIFSKKYKNHKSIVCLSYQDNLSLELVIAYRNIFSLSKQIHLFLLKSLLYSVNRMARVEVHVRIVDLLRFPFPPHEKNMSKPIDVMLYYIFICLLLLSFILHTYAPMLFLCISMYRFPISAWCRFSLSRFLDRRMGEIGWRKLATAGDVI